MRRKSLPIAMALLLAAAACGPGKVVVTMQVDMPNPDGEGTITKPVPDVVVNMLPFDRDSVFDSLAAAYGTPEPPVPQWLQEQRDSVRAAQERWQSAERRWANLRDTLEKLNNKMKEYSRGEAAYVSLFRQWNDLDGQLQSVNRVKDRYFQAFDTLQKATISASDSIRILRENWADQAYASVNDVFDAKLKAAGVTRMPEDTTDANGVANLQGKPGTWYIHATYELPYTELYWNIPVDVKRGDPIPVQLTRENATERELM
jgi:hypothetical protein